MWFHYCEAITISVLPQKDGYAKSPSYKIQKSDIIKAVQNFLYVVSLLGFAKKKALEINSALSGYAAPL